MQPKINFIINPIAGQGAGKLALPEIERLAKESFPVFGIVCTEYPGHAIELARQAAIGGDDILVAVGGDGTSNEVLNGIMQANQQGYRNTSMGIIAIGRGEQSAGRSMLDA